MFRTVRSVRLTYASLWPINRTRIWFCLGGIIGSRRGPVTANTQIAENQKQRNRESRKPNACKEDKIGQSSIEAIKIDMDFRRVFLTYLEAPKAILVKKQKK